MVRRLSRTAYVASFVLTVWISWSTLSGQAEAAIATASSALRTGNYTGAEKILAVELKRAPKDIRLHTLLGVAYSGEGKPGPALASFELALKLSPHFLPALEGAAQVAYQSGGSRAKPLLLQILAISPDDPTANAMLGTLDYRAGDCTDAVEHLGKAVLLPSNQALTLMEYGSCLANLHRTEEAVEILGKAASLAPANAQVHYNLSLAEWSAGRSEDALATLIPLLSGSNVPEDVLTLTADIYESKGDTQRAVEVLRRAILSHPQDKSAYLQFASLSYKHNSPQVGVDMIDAGLIQLPNEAELYVARGALLSQTPDSASALKDFDTAVRLDPNLSFARAARGLAKSQAHDDAAALNNFRKAAEQHPDDAFTLYLLAESLSEGSSNPGTPAFAEGIAAAKRSVSLDPTRLEARDLLASLYLRAGETGLALEQSQEALRIDPTDEAALYHEILARRKGEKKSEVSALVQRMMKIREEKARAPAEKLYRLVEGPASEAKE